MKHLDQSELAKRWNISPHTLENMRWRKVGPPYIKIGGRVLYRLEDIEAYERANLFLPKKPSVEPPASIAPLGHAELPQPSRDDDAKLGKFLPKAPAH
jgi:hypothetical protein